MKKIQTKKRPEQQMLKLTHCEAHGCGADSQHLLLTFDKAEDQLLLISKIIPFSRCIHFQIPTAFMQDYVL